nr:WG repeat-containing protein [uncultured Sunxiuqinia sp.]
MISFFRCTNSETAKKECNREYADLIVSEGQDKLFMVSTDKQFRFDSPCAFVNEKGDTVIPYGKYHIWDSVNFYTYAIVKSPDGIVGINRKGEIMFDAYLWGDAQLEDISEGLFRIKRNGKIGYANEDGEIIIPCQFECAEQFKNRQAKVTLECDYKNNEIDQIEMKSDNWFYIDKKGNKITTPQQKL